MKKKKQETSWEGASRWYHQTVGKTGHTYHQTVILPQLIPLLNLQEGDSLLDLGCGQGILSRHLPPSLPYWGVDLSPALIREAKQLSKNKNHHFIVSDISAPLPVRKKDFRHAVFLLSLQNVEHPKDAIRIASQHLKLNGKLILVLNHPCFRIPRQSAWLTDEQKKLQSRRIDSYSSPLKIPITTHPSKGETGGTTWSFHFSLSDLFGWFKEANIAVTDLHEWHSQKTSTGAKAKMENRARKEIPLFLAIEGCRIK